MKRLILSFIIFININLNAQTAGDGVTIDGYTYQTVIINGREWMAENLKATHFEDGTSINQATSINSFVSASELSPVFINSGSIEFVNEGFGRLYNYQTNNLNGSGPGNLTIKTGWRIPTKNEWTDMITHTNGGSQDNMRKLGITWGCSQPALDSYGFSIMPVGRIKVEGNTSIDERDNTGAYFWAIGGSDGFFPYVAINCNGIPQNNYMTLINNSTTNKRSALSVRLIKEAPLSNNEYKKSKAYIYPNPVQKELNIESQETVLRIEIFDLLGKQILISKDKNIDVSGLQKGIYLVKINTDEGSLMEKIIKQ